MIKFTTSIDDITKCWQEAFGDSTEDILFFIENVKDAECLAYYDDENESEIASMLYLVNSSIGKYIYAACTLKKYRNFGYMSSLLDYCKHNYNKICLIPANEGLINYYKSHNFKKTININNLKFEQIDEINEYLFDGCELKQPIVLIYEKEK